MVKHRSSVRLALLIAVSAFALWGSGEKMFAGTQANTQTESVPANAKAASQDNGERVFVANCSRCHKPPMTIPQRITGTVVMHMRVRAKLSRQDEQALLRYLAP